MTGEEIVREGREVVVAHSSEQEEFSVVNGACEVGSINQKASIEIQH